MLSLVNEDYVSKSKNLVSSLSAVNYSSRKLFSSDVEKSYLDSSMLSLMTLFNTVDAVYNGSKLIEKVTGTNYITQLEFLQNIDKEIIDLGLTYTEMAGDLLIVFASSPEVCDSDC